MNDMNTLIFRRSNTMKLVKLFELGCLQLLGLVVLLAATPVSAFDSGSTGVNGAFAPVSDTSIVLPPNGILNFTTMNIPSGVTVRISSNLANTPAYILVQGDAVIDGVIDLSGIDGESVGGSPAGGYSGGLPQTGSGGNGQGPGAGRGAVSAGAAGNGASYGTIGTIGSRNTSTIIAPVYGSTSLQPLLGGSGGGASSNSGTTPGNRGGGGGGSVLLAASGTLTLAGSIIANGGKGASYIPSVSSSYGAGGGSGGGVRLIASTLAGSGNIDIAGGVRGSGHTTNIGRDGGTGGIGRARLEADVFNFSGSVKPNLVTTSAPLPVFPSNLPSIRITSVGGASVPTNPIGENDVILPSSIVNPVTVAFAATDVPLGSTIELTISPISGSSTTVVSAGLSGTLASSTDSVQAILPQGASVLLASVSFAITNQTASLYAPFTNGEMVARVELRSTMGNGSSSIRLTTKSGRIIDVPAMQAKL
jgi:hypothetical protein